MNENKPKIAPGDHLERWQVYGFIALGVVFVGMAINTAVVVVPAIMEQHKKADEQRQKENERKPDANK